MLQKKRHCGFEGSYIISNSRDREENMYIIEEREEQRKLKMCHLKYCLKFNEKKKKKNHLRKNLLKFLYNIKHRFRDNGSLRICDNYFISHQ